MKAKLIALVASIVVIATGATLFFITRDHSSTDNKSNQTTQKDEMPKIELNVPESSTLLSQETKTLKVAILTDEYNKISRVEYLVDGTMTSYSTAAPFAVIIDLTTLSPGDHTIQAVAYGMKGQSTKSNVFRFTLTASQPIAPVDERSQDIVRGSVSIEGLNRLVRGSTGSSSASNSGGSSNSGGGNNGGGDNGGGGDDGGPTEAPLPDSPPALVCGVSSLLSGPATPPSGAVTVLAGDNSALNLNQASKTYWFAPGVHYLGTHQFDQIQPGNNSV